MSCILTIYYETVEVDSAWIAHGEWSCISGLHYSAFHIYAESTRQFSAATSRTPDAWAHQGLLSVQFTTSMPPRTVSLDLKARIPALRHLGYSVKEICGLLDIKKSLVYQTLRYHAIHGVCYNPTSHRRGRPRKLTSTDISFIKALISQHHTIYLDEIQEQLLSRRGAQISIPTLMRTLCRMQLTNKDVSGRALERNVEQRAIFMNYMAEIVQDLNMLMFGDEAAKDERTCVRKRGWSLRGSRCIQRKCFVRGRRYSILPILTLDGIITYDIIEGSVTSERFVQFLRELVVGSNLLFFLVNN